MSSVEPDLSVIIPAHNEEAVIKRCLESLQADLRQGRIEVIVICNGCSDRTADLSRAASSLITVVESETASKHQALNLGDEMATGRHRAYLDADTVLSSGALSAITELLDTPGILAASPKVAFDVTNCSWAARQFHRIWAPTSRSGRPSEPASMLSPKKDAHDSSVFQRRSVMTFSSPRPSPNGIERRLRAQPLHRSFQPRFVR
jgi:glycosyltransferase involved in cell wall biosynthesis